MIHIVCKKLNGILKGSMMIKEYFRKEFSGRTLDPRLKQSSHNAITKFSMLKFNITRFYI